jgi:hypothetical protein
MCLLQKKKASVLLWWWWWWWWFPNCQEEVDPVAPIKTLRVSLLKLEWSDLLQQQQQLQQQHHHMPGC